MVTRVSQREANHCLWVSDGFVEQAPATPKRQRPPTGALRATTTTHTAHTTTTTTAMPATHEHEHELDSDGEVATYEVERIVGERMRQGLTEFKVRWEGYGPADDTWEPFENLENCTVFQEYWATKTIKVATPRRKSPNSGGQVAPRSRTSGGSSGGASSAAAAARASSTRGRGGGGGGGNVSRTTRAPAMLSTPLKCLVPASRRGPRGELWRELAQGGFKRPINHPATATPTRPANASGWSRHASSGSSRYASGRRLLMAISTQLAQQPRQIPTQPLAQPQVVARAATGSDGAAGCRGGCHPTNCVCSPAPVPTPSMAASAPTRHCSGHCHATNCTCTPPPPAADEEVEGELDLSIDAMPTGAL